MRIRNAILAVLVCGVAGLVANTAEARKGGGRGHSHGHGHGHHRHYFYPSFFFSAPLYYPYYQYPYYYDPAPVYYIERPQPQPQPPAQPGVAPQMHSGSYWYCPSVAAYYPSVPSCVEGWQQVPPPPPPPG